MILLLTGKPGVGKSTLLSRVKDHIKSACYGVIAKEIRDQTGLRVGFEAQKLSEPFERQVFAHMYDISSNLTIGPYKVSLEAIDNFIVPELQSAINSKGIIFFDEIGRMQSFSKKFLDCTREAFNSKTLMLATIVLEPEPWSLEFKNHPNALVIEVTPSNRDFLCKLVLMATQIPFDSLKFNELQNRKLYDILKDCLINLKEVQLAKLVNNALPYLAKNKVSKTSSGFLVQGEHGEHKVTLQGFKSCDCDLFNGRNGYQAGECSHIQAAELFSLI